MNGYIRMKDGSVHTVTSETAHKIQDALLQASRHLFIHIDELDLMINSAEVKEIQAREQETLQTFLPEPKVTTEETERGRDLLRNWINTH